MAKNDGLFLLLLGLGAFYLFGKKRDAPLFIPGTNGVKFLTTYLPGEYYYREISEPYPGADPRDFIAHVESGIPATTPGYHPAYQSKAYEYAWKSGRMEPAPTSLATQISMRTVPSYDYDDPEIQTRIQAYKQYAKSRTQTSTATGEKKARPPRRGGGGLRRR